MPRWKTLKVISVAIAVAISVFLYLASKPRWEVEWRGVGCMLSTRESLFTLLRHERSLAPEARMSWDAGIAERNANATWWVAGRALAAGVGSVPVYYALRVVRALVTAPARPD